MINQIINMARKFSSNIWSWWVLVRNNCGSKIRTSKLANAGYCETLWERLFRESTRREQKPPRTNGRKKAMEPICSTPFSFLFLSLSISLSLFACFSTQRRNLCYLLVTFIWSPRVLDLSHGLLSHSPSTLFSPLFLLPSSSSSLSLSPTNSPQPRTVRNFLFRISDP